MSVLVDTSVWVAHFRQRHEHLVQLLLADQAMVHPLVLGELACGTPPEPRRVRRTHRRCIGASTAPAFSAGKAFSDSVKGESKQS